MDIRWDDRTNDEPARQDRRVVPLVSRSPAIADPEVYDLLLEEGTRQRDTIELVASDNYAWPAATAVLASPAASKLTEGYPGSRVNSGCEVLDTLELLAVDRAKRLFNADHANVQPHSGVQANMAVYLACLQPRDTILSMSEFAGGHSSHGGEGSFARRYFNVVEYGVDREEGLIDIDHVRSLAIKHRPRLIVCGASSYPRVIDAQAFRAVADECSAYLLFDMAHVSGLVAGGAYPSPVKCSDFVTLTAHKTLAGPRCGGLILCKNVHAQKIDGGVWPGIQSAPAPQSLAAKAIVLHIASQLPFQNYVRAVCENADRLSCELSSRGLSVLTGGTDTHLIMLDLRETGYGGAEAEARLAEVGITSNRMAIPADEDGVNACTGLRLGTPAITMRGFTSGSISDLAELIADAVFGRGRMATHRARVAAMAKAYPPPRPVDETWL
jgi:glycine hydroxymethyltransferase